MKILSRIVALIFISVLSLGVFIPAVGAAGVHNNTVVATSPFWAVRRIVQGFVAHPGKSYACKASEGNYSHCPMTTRLKRRANQLAKLGANPICRCQNTAQSIEMSYANRSGVRATVATVWRYGPHSKESITFVAVRTVGMSSWQVDDSYCTGHPNTSLYMTPKGPCH
jgi:hypothetical protein